MKSSVSSVSSVVQTHSIRVLGAALLLGVVSGCYEYVPVRPDVVPPTEDVRVKVTDAAAARLVKELGTYTSELDGRFALMELEMLEPSLFFDLEPDAPGRFARAVRELL